MEKITVDHKKNSRETWFMENILEEYGLVLNEVKEGRWTSMTAKGRGVTDLLL